MSGNRAHDNEDTSSVSGGTMGVWGKTSYTSLAASQPRVDDPGTLDTGVGVRTYDDRGAYEYQP